MSYPREMSGVPLLQRNNRRSGLSLLFASLCIVDIFGVFPIIALPGAIVQCGLLGIPLVVVVGTIQIYTAVLVGKSWNLATSIDPSITRKNRYPMAAVTELTLGRSASLVVAALLDLSIFGGGVPNLLVASQNLQLFGLKVSESNFNLSFCYWLLVVGVLLCPVMWLGSPRDMKWLTMFSTSTISVATLLIWWSILNDHRSPDVEPIPSSPSWEQFISGYGMLAFQFDVHPTLMTIQVDMKRPKDINRAIVFSFLTIVASFGITTGLVVWRYGGSATANVLEIVPPGWTIQVAILLAALQLCLSSAIGHSALFQHLEDQLHVRRSFGWRRCALRSAVVFLAVAVGESVPRFDIVMSLIGGTLTGPLVFILPPLMYARAKARLRVTDNPRRSSAPGFLCSGPEHHPKSDEFLSNPRAHSRSTHYGFRNGDEDKNDGYSFIYYDGEMETIEDEIQSFTEYGSISTKPLDGPRSESLPAMTHTDHLSVQNQTRLEGRMNRAPRKFWGVPDLSDCFGYCVVIIGIFTTISSTYINIRNTIRYVRFIPPCIINATAELPSLI
ncbi:proton-coupled amino acid transporter 3 [Copidosoma floridanum]|uniref:proton-coupled amino acid transporter 3 n=1 Tax=Copidosoma floridanum TaxID=29053 RepID=UPI0006C9CAC2|nr:proton-coupled amino acid transporter 3 [Copidosoma floridanum]